MSITKLHITAHAIKRMTERGISIEQLKAAVNYSDSRHPQGWRGEHKGIVYRFTKVIDGRSLRVVAEVKSAEAWLVTGYWIS